LAACCSVRRDRSVLPEAISPAARLMLDAGLDAADDLLELIDGGVAVITHAGEHAVEVALHAHGEVTARDRLQQGRHLHQVLVGGLHQAVEPGHHVAEIIGEAIFIAAQAEVAGRGGRRQPADLAVDRRQAGLGSSIAWVIAAFSPGSGSMSTDRSPRA
jgi:hypothetical protein